ncbi:copper amine oxidase N-terminal domain-containing protein [Paenibacillus sp. CC-CFT747]|nr:copper amine oxidase N-terminal domain-containing protein [Paenibacillus sp. CC-CFT747]
MKKLMIGFACGVLVSLATTAVASSSLVTTLFPLHFTFNGQSKEPDTDSAILNYNGHAYVPVRFIAENMGGLVGYHHESQTVSIRYPDPRSVSSELSSIQTEGSFQLALYSAKKAYSAGEPLTIWSTLENVGQTAVSLAHSTPILQYSIKDRSGTVRNEASFDAGGSVLEKGAQYLQSLTPSSIRYFNFQRSGSRDFEAFLQTPNSDILEPGIYTVGVQAVIRPQNQEEIRLYREMDIEIK